MTVANEKEKKETFASKLPIEVAKAFMSLLVGIGLATIGFLYFQRAPKIEYEVNMSAPFDCGGNLISILTLSIFNTGNLRADEIECPLDMKHPCKVLQSKLDASGKVNVEEQPGSVNDVERICLIKADYLAPDDKIVYEARVDVKSKNNNLVLPLRLRAKDSLGVQRPKPTKESPPVWVFVVVFIIATVVAVITTAGVIKVTSIMAKLIRELSAKEALEHVRASGDKAGQPPNESKAS